MSRTMTPSGPRQAMHSQGAVCLGPYTRDCLDKSWAWLKDPEIKRLTMAPDFTRDQQLAFFEQLPRRTDYLIWSVRFEGQAVGAAGLKNHRGAMAEYWGYLGERQCWGRGLGRSLVAAVEAEARARGFSALDLKVSADNLRAIALYHKAGFVIDPGGSVPHCLRMVKPRLS